MRHLLDVIKYSFFSLLITGCLSTELNPTTDSATDESQDPPAKVTKVYAYSGGQYTNVINSFEVDKSSGALTPTSQPTIAGENLPMIQAVTFDKKFLLSINYSSHSFSTYSIDPASGNLTLVAHTPLGGGTGPAWVVTHPTLPVAYIAESGTNKVAVIDISDTGAVSIRGRVNAGSGVTALEINSSGSVLYSVDQNINQIGIYIVNGAGDIALANTAATPASSAPNQAKIHPSGKFLYVANWGTNSVSAFVVNGTNLTLIETEAGSGAAGGGIYTVSVSPDGKNLYAARPYGTSLIPMAINETTGELTSGTVDPLQGAVNAGFWGNYMFVASWIGGSSQLPILTRSYDSTNGMGATLSSSSPVRGIYQITVVEIEQP